MMKHDSCSWCVTVKILIVQKGRQIHQKLFWKFVQFSVLLIFLPYSTLQYYSISWIVRYNLCFVRCFHSCRSVGWRAQRQWLPLDSFLPSVDDYYSSQSGGGTLCHWAQNRDPSTLWRWATSAWMLNALEFAWHCLLMTYLCMHSNQKKSVASTENMGFELGAPRMMIWIFDVCAVALKNTYDIGRGVSMYQCWKIIGIMCRLIPNIDTCTEKYNPYLTLSVALISLFLL